ncbi:hypothetical protein [Photorhabdus sp. SF281]
MNKVISIDDLMLDIEVWMIALKQDTGPLALLKLKGFQLPTEIFSIKGE